MKNILLALLLAPTLLLAEYKQTISSRTILETKKAIPVGIYHISPSAYQKARRLADMKEMKRMGFDYAHVSLDATDGPTIELAKKLNLGIHAEYVNNNKPEDVIEALGLFDADSPVFAHTPGDDVDLKYTVEQYKLKELAYKRAHPDLLTLASVGLTKNIFTFTGLSDKTAQQSYPIPNEPISATPYAFRRAKTAADLKNTTFVATVQSFRWANRRYPTPQEVEVMSWWALACGAHEILYYTYYDVTSDLNTQPTIKTSIRNFILKLREYEHYFLNGVRTETPSSTGTTARWVLDGKTLTVIINNNTKAVSISET